MNRTCALVLSALLAACSGKSPTPDAGVDAGPVCLDPDAGPPADAGEADGGDFSCLGQVRPTVAVQDLSIAGFVAAQMGFARVRVPGAQVELFGPGGARVDSAESDTDGGNYELGHGIGCTAFDGHIRASHPDAGYYDFYYYPPTPWQRGRTDLELVILNDSSRSLAALVAGVTIMNGTGQLALGVEDCTRTPVSNAVVTTMPAGELRYIATNGLPGMANMFPSTTSKGQALIFNLPPGDVTVTVTAQGKTLTRVVPVRADSVTATTLVP